MKQLQNLLRRQTTSSFFIPEIDGFRFFAIITVLLYHLNTHVSRFFSTSNPEFFKDSWIYVAAREGGIGVNVFFAISGFILALPFARQRMFHEKKIDLKAYYIRRITRLEPPYVVSLVLFLFVHVLILHENFSNILPNFLASLFYVHNIVFNEWSKINPVAWSLEVEVQFYLLAPLLASVFSIRNVAGRRLVLLAAIVVSMLHYNWNYDWIEAYHLRKSLLMHLHQFLIGFIFADFFLNEWSDTLKYKSYGYDLLSALALASLLVFNEPFNFFHDVVFGLCLFISFVGVFKGRLTNAFFTNPWIVIIGGMCYSIYLLHYALIAFLANGTRNLFIPEWGYSLNYIVQALVITPVVLFISGLFFVIIERPCMNKQWPAKVKSKVLSIFVPQSR